MKPAVMILALCAVAPAATAQRLPRPLPPAEPCCSRRVLLTIPDTTRLPTRSSTFGERALFGLIGGIGATFAMGAAYPDGPPAGIFMSGYALASALGVELVALPHEGARPLGALLGAVAGTIVGLLALAPVDCDYCDDPPTGIWFGITTYALAVPLLAAAGHGLDSRLHGYRPPELPSRAESGALIRIEGPDGKHASGQVLALTDSTITLRRWAAVTVQGTRYDTLGFRLDSISHAWIRAGSNWRRGVLIGAGIGAAIGLTVVAVDHAGAAPATPLSTAAFLTFLGGGLGAVVGATNTRWEPTSWPPGTPLR